MAAPIVVILLAALSTQIWSVGPFKYLEEDAPVPRTAVKPAASRPCLTMVLGGGGPRGFAHLGVLQAMEDRGIKADAYVGTSAGAIFGGLLAGGMSANQVWDLTRETPLWRIFDINPWADRGWISGQGIQDTLNELTGYRQIQDLNKPLVVVATVRDRNVPVFFQTGNTGVAIRASSAIRGVISPVNIAGTEYEDGDESMPLAVEAAKQLGSRYVISVDVSATLQSIPDGVDERQRRVDTLRRERIDIQARLADLQIHADLGYWAPTRRHYFERARLIGYEQGLAAMERIQFLRLQCILEDAGKKPLRP